MVLYCVVGSIWVDCETVRRYLPSGMDRDESIVEAPATASLRAPGA